MEILHVVDLLSEILLEFETFNPQYCREYNDPRMSVYFISITKQIYIVVVGCYGFANDIYINTADIKTSDIMTEEGLRIYTNYNRENITPKCVFKLDVDNFCGSIDDIMKQLKNEISKITEENDYVLK